VEIIDAHVHVWPPGTSPPDVGLPYKGPADPEHLLGEMNRAGVRGAVLITPRVLGTDNSYAVRAVRTHPDRYLAVVGVVDHHAPGTEAQRLEREASAGELQGVRLHPCFDPDLNLAAPALAPIWEVCAARRLVISVHADPPQYEQIRQLVEERPDLIILIDHLGRFPLQDGAASPSFARLLDLARFQGVNLKVSSIPWLLRGGTPEDALQPHLSKALAAFGPDRLVWGADWPVLIGTGWTYQATVGHALRLVLPANVQAALFSGNVRRLYQIL
jgi:L-fuconolactonase